MSPLYQEINRWIGMPFRWGETDCCLVVADWVKRVTGREVAADLRQTYSDQGSCQQRTGYMSNPLKVAARCMETVGGFARTESPVAGDVALIKVLLEGRVTAVGAICLGRSGWAVKAPRGALTLRGTEILGVMRAWSIGYVG